MAARKRGRGNGSAHGLSHMVLIATRLKQPELVAGNLSFILSNDYILPSLFTQHNPNWLFNADALHSLPAVIMEMLVYSRAGVIELLPACSEQYSSGTISGVMCRTQAKIDSLHWDLTRRQLQVVIISGKDQMLELKLRKAITSAEVDGQVVPMRDNSLQLSFKEGVARDIVLKWRD